ncbi:putative phosphonate ABC transporter [Caerostris extrusa]|uniref:Phosphonate ABC transporter n=1 Tax=Caerostris extrusa TaxID=172846 RepID=A0AAV4VHF0_CAEEX|nr:putative phosphonate ABC transporter [Caerostris extrusa]
MRDSVTLQINETLNYSEEASYIGPSAAKRLKCASESLNLDEVKATKSNGSNFEDSCVNENAHWPVDCATPVSNSTEIEESNSSTNCGDSEQLQCTKSREETDSDNSQDSVLSGCSTVINSASDVSQSAVSPSSAESNDPCEVQTVEASEESNVPRRTRSSSNKRTKGINLRCPICSLTIRSAELETHFKQEVDKLTQVSRKLRKLKTDDSGINTTFVQVKSNRENRLSAKIGQYTAKNRKEIQCPGCSLWLSGPGTKLNEHISHCMEEDNLDEYIVVDDDEEDNFEEYTIGDETRIRAVSLIPGGHNSLQGQTVRNQHSEDDDVDIDVDTIAHGQPHKDKENDENLEQLRKAVLLDPNVQPCVLESRKWSNNEVSQSDEAKESRYLFLHLSIKMFSFCNHSHNLESAESTNSEGFLTDHTVDLSDICSEIVSNKNDNTLSKEQSFERKIKDINNQNQQVKCLICMDFYTKPVVSTSCWHVYCEECWLMTLGVKKRLVHNAI